MVTPAGSGCADGRPQDLEARRRRHFARDPAAPAPEVLHDARYRYESPSRFTATMIDDARPVPMVFVMTRDGLHWQLSDIRLPK